MADPELTVRWLSSGEILGRFRAAELAVTGETGAVVSVTAVTPGTKRRAGGDWVVGMELKHLLEVIYGI